MDSNEYRPPRGSFGIRVIIGVCVILAGVLLTLDQMDALDADDYLALWPIGLIAIGLTRLPSRHTTDLLFAGLFVGVGAWALASNLGWLHEAPWDYLLPLFLVFLGAHLLLAGFRHRRVKTGTEDFVSIFAMLGGGERRVASQHFAGADLTAIMGGFDLDLRQVQLDPGETVVIQVFAIWGGMALRVPQDWRIDFQILPILGGYGDKTEQTVRAGAPTVRIQGSVIMGGFEIKN